MRAATTRDGLGRPSFAAIQALVRASASTSSNGSLEPDPATTEDILRRCSALVPAIAEAEVLRVKVGLRPWRPEVRLERVGEVIHCYGDGGVSWGCAAEVAELAA